MIRGADDAACRFSFPAFWPPALKPDVSPTFEELKFANSAFPLTLQNLFDQIPGRTMKGQQSERVLLLSKALNLKF